jgi:Leucine-rich repeat (LRR) protein
VTKDGKETAPTDDDKIPVETWIELVLPMNGGGPITRLKYVSLAGNKLTDQFVGRLNRCVELEGLDLADNPDITDRGLQSLNHTNLKELSVSGTGQPKNISMLPFDHVAVSDAGVLGLLTRSRTTLRYLNLSGTATLSTPNSEAIAAIRQMKNLQTLNVAGTGINDAGLWEVWGLAEMEGRQLTSLVSLNVSDTLVSDSGFVDDKGNVGFPALKTVLISATDLRVTTGGINRRNAFAAKAFPTQFNRALLVKAAQ